MTDLDGRMAMDAFTRDTERHALDEEQDVYAGGVIGLEDLEAAMSPHSDDLFARYQSPDGQGTNGSSLGGGAGSPFELSDRGGGGTDRGDSEEVNEQIGSVFGRLGVRPMGTGTETAFQEPVKEEDMMMNFTPILQHYQQQQFFPSEYQQQQPTAPQTAIPIPILPTPPQNPTAPQPRAIAAAAVKPNLSDAATREERKVAGRHGSTGLSREISSAADGSTEDEGGMSASRVVYPAVGDVQGAALMIHGIKRKGAKSRVETQIKMRISVVQPGTADDAPGTTGYDRIGTFRAIRLQPGLGVKRRAKKAAEIDQTLSALDPAQVVQLETEVWCTDNPGRRAFACVKCVMRERKRAMSKSSAAAGGKGRGKGRKGGEDSDEARQSEQDVPAQVDADGLTEEERNKIILFNCGNLVELVEGECELPMRVTCYCRHHKEKTGFRIVMHLRDMHGRLVASGQTPTIMITDDHKTSGIKASSATATTNAGTTTDTGILSASTSKSATAASLASRARTKKVREPSASTEEDRRARAGKAKPYDRLAGASSDKTGNGVMSPRGSYPRGLSMTPLNGRSIPGSPIAGQGSERNSYFALPITNVQPGSGGVSPSLLMNGNGNDTDQHGRSLPVSPLGISDALPAISQRLSDWAAQSSWQHAQSAQQQQFANAGYYPTQPQPTGLALNLPHAQSETLMQTDEHDNAWAYASSEGGLSAPSHAPGSSSFSQDAFSFASPRSSLHGQDNMYGYHSGTSGTGASDISVNNLQAMRFEPEPDFESMLNLSPQESPVDLPMDGTSPASNPSNADYQSIGWSPQAAGIPPQPVPAFDARMIPEGPPRPKITRLVPMEGPTHGGIEVTVLGENFYPGMVCAFGSFHALTVQTYGPTTIVCVLPPSPNPGQVPVHVLDANGQPPPAWVQPPIYFTYKDATDRKLMEMALTAVGLRVTGKVVGAVEIARRIMSAPGAGQEGSDASQTQGQFQRTDMSIKERELADELAKTVYSTPARDTQSAILKFLSAFVTAPSHERGSRRRKHSQTALNHVNSEGQTILHLASLLRYDRLVKLLLRANATIDIHDRNGYSALAFAAIGGNVACVQLLLEAGAKVGAYTFTNQTALSLAQKAGHDGIAKLLAHHSGKAPSKGKPRRLSEHSSRGSVDADNPSSTEDVDSPTAVSDALSPSRLTTMEDIVAVKPPTRLRSLEVKSDGTVTPRARVNPIPSISDDPPPYAAIDGASWLQRTLSHIPGAQMMPPTPQLKDFIPPVLWDKLPSAQLLIPHLPNLPSATSFRPGEIMEQQWASQAWLAVPIQAWMNALPGVGQGETGEKMASEHTSTVPLETTVPTVQAFRRHKTPTRDRNEGQASTKVRRAGVGLQKRKVRTDNTRYLTEGGQVQHDKKPDRMLFLFWLPVLAMAFCYTIITAVPYALGRALLAPALRMLRL